MRHRVILALILLLYLGLGVYYSVTVPLFEAPDELYHFFFAYHVATTGQLPVQNPDAPALWAQEGSQPPLYYLLAAVVIAPVPVERIADYLWENPHRNVGVPFEPGNKNYLVHTEKERWPYRGLPLAVHLARWLSLLLGTLTVAGTYLLVREVWPHMPYLGLAAAAVVAFIPQFVFISSAVSNDVMIATTATWTLWWGIRCLRRGGGYGHALLLGLGVGLAMLSKLSGLAFFPLGGAILLWASYRGQWRRPVGRSLVLFVLAVVGVAGWWYVRNWRLYGDPTGLNQMLAYVGYRSFSLTWDNVLGEWRGMRWSFWGLFGWFNVPMGLRTYRLLDAITLFIALGWGVALWRRRREPSVAGRGVMVLGVWVGLIFASLWRWVTLTLGAQGRLLFPAIAAIAALLVWGWVQWVPSRWRALWAAVLPTGLLLLAAIAPGRWIAPAYAYPPRITPAEIPDTAREVNILFGDRIRLWAVDIQQITVYPGDTVDITLYLSKAGPLPVDYSLSIHLFGREMEKVGQINTFPGWGTYPTRLWQDGEVIVDRYQVSIAPTARTPTLLRVSVGFFNYWTGTQLPARTVTGQPVTPWVGSLRLVAREPQKLVPQVPLRAVFGDELALVGIDPPPKRVRPGEELTFRLYWKTLRPARASYTVFTHLIRTGDPTPVAQQDKVPLDGDYPTLAWAPGEVVVDTYRIVVPQDALPGEYNLIAGLYQWPTLQRLPLTDGPGNAWVPEAATLLVLTVEPAP